MAGEEVRCTYACKACPTLTSVFGDFCPWLPAPHMSFSGSGGGGEEGGVSRALWVSGFGLLFAVYEMIELQTPDSQHP